MEVKEKIATYDTVFEEKNYDKRLSDAQKATDHFYTLITKFYERGWGQSFHFARRKKKEAFHDSILRHEHYLSSKLGLKAGDEVLDAGCGIMGPARNIAKFSGANITGITINEHQVERCKTLNSQTNVAGQLKVIQGDFMSLPFPNNHFDKIYAIEALCHAPDLAGVYQQIYDKLKPGGVAGFYEWAMTDKYDPNNAEHLKAKEMIEYGNGICEMKTITEIEEAISLVGFERIETEDLAATASADEIVWYHTLQSGWSLAQFRQTKLSRTVMHYMLRGMETFGIAKKGVSKAQNVLLVAADGLVAGGKLGIFTPMYFVLLRKPW